MKTNLNQWLNALGLAVELKQRELYIYETEKSYPKNDDKINYAVNRALQTLIELEEIIADVADNWKHLISLANNNIDALIQALEVEYLTSIN